MKSDQKLGKNNCFDQIKKLTTVIPGDLKWQCFVLAVSKHSPKIKLWEFNFPHSTPFYEIMHSNIHVNVEIVSCLNEQGITV